MSTSVRGRADPLREAPASRVVVADGTTGTMFQAQDPGMDDFQQQEGRNEILDVTRPDTVRPAHAENFAAGVDCVETHPFGSIDTASSAYDIADRIHELSKTGAALTAPEPRDTDLIGLNCSTGPAEMSEHLRYPARHSTTPLTCMPHAGLPVLTAVKGIQLKEYASWLDKGALFMGQWGLKQARTGDRPTYEELVGTGGRPRPPGRLDQLQTKHQMEAAVVHGYVRCVSKGDDLILLGDDGNERTRFTFPRRRRGRRFSLGYGAWPHLEDRAKIAGLLQPERTGAELSEEFQLHPGQSTDATVIHHPEAKCLNTGGRRP